MIVLNVTGRANPLHVIIVQSASRSTPCIPEGLRFTKGSFSDCRNDSGIRCCGWSLSIFTRVNQKRMHTRYRIVHHECPDQTDVCTRYTFFLISAWEHLAVFKGVTLFCSWILPEHDCQGDYCDHHNSTCCQEQVDRRWLVHLLQSRSIFLCLPVNNGNVGCILRILLQC